MDDPYEINESPNKPTLISCTFFLNIEAKIEGCGLSKKWRYNDLVRLMVDKEMLIDWLIEEGLMAKEPLCPMCDGGMGLARCEDRSDLFKWECRRQEKGKRHKAEISIRKGGWFEKSKMTLEEILKLTYWWCQDLDQAQIKHELGLESVL